MSFISCLEKYIECKITGEELSSTLKKHENNYEWSCRIVLEIVENKKMYCLSDRFIKRFCSDCYHKVFSPIGASQLATFLNASISLQSAVVKQKYLDSLLAVLSRPENVSEENLKRINETLGLPMDEERGNHFVDYLRSIKNR